MSKDYARSLDKIHHKILQDLVKLPENSFCADCAMRGTPYTYLHARLARLLPRFELLPRGCSWCGSASRALARLLYGVDRVARRVGQQERDVCRVPARLRLSMASTFSLAVFYVEEGGVVLFLLLLCVLALMVSRGWCRDVG